MMWVYCLALIGYLLSDLLSIIWLALLNLTYISSYLAVTA
jgi:hypothetical protein